MSKFEFKKPETALLHAGQETPDSETGSRALPIYQTTSYVFPDTEHAQGVFGLTKPGNIYTRITNPTLAAFEERVAQLEDGVAAVSVASGMAAISFAILNIAEAGDEIIADSNLYGGTYNLFVNTLPKYGINVTFVDGTDLQAIEDAITDKTKLVFGETITNPSLNVLDIEGIADIAHKHGIPLIIDNTFAPYIAKPINFGADVVVHSATKWIGGHGTSIGGVVVDGGHFDWTNGKFPGFTTPDESYNNLRYADLGESAFAMKLRVQLLRDIGPALSPFNAFLFVQGLESLHVRMERHVKNAEIVVDYLQNNPAVEWINFPGIEGSKSHELAKKYFKTGFGSIITFGIKGGREAGRKLIDNIQLWSHVANVGDAKSLIIHPASTTHQQLDEEDLKASGVSAGLVRLSIGLEAPEDIIAALDKAIAVATGEEAAYENEEEMAVEWLLATLYDRTEAGAKRKSIAAVNVEEDAVKQLQRFGYATPVLEEAETVDAVWVEGEISSELIDQLVNKQVKILFTNETTEAAEKAKSAGITVIHGVNPAEEAYRLRTERQ